TMSFREFLLGEVRYSALKQQYPDLAENLFEKTEQDAKERLGNYRSLAKQ
ncbi:pyruvate-ferredoxin/flavodoxin oxidoreductase, partial [Sporomusa acidovorans]